MMFKVFSFSPIIRQYVLVIVVNLIAIACGLSIAWPSPVLVKLRSDTETVLPRPITEDEGSWLVSVGYLCGALTISIPGFLVDRIGRKYCILLACVPKIIVGLLYTFATSLWMLMLGRVLNGITDGFMYTVVPMYASEIANKEVRGSMGSIHHLFLSFGQLVMFAMGPVVSYLTLNVVVTSVALLATVPVVFLPDSPYFLYSKGEVAKAKKTLTFLRGSATIADEEIKEYAVSNTDSSVNKLKLFRDRIFLKSMIIVVIFGIGLPLMGYIAVSYYLQTILESTQTSLKPETGSAVVGVIQMAAGISTMFLTDRFGRKPILVITIIGTAIGMLGLGVFFYMKDSISQQAVSGAMNYMPLVSLIIVVFCFNAGPGSLYWVMVAELFDGAARGFGVSTGLIIGQSSIFLTSKYFPSVTATFGPVATYGFFSVICALMCFFVVFCVPETKGKSFAEIQVILGANKLPRENRIDDL